MGYLLLTMAILGGAGLYLLMPGGRRQLAPLGLLLIVGAAAALVTVVVKQTAGDAPWVWFVVLALIGLWGGVRVITHSKPVYSALYFILVVVSTTGLLLLAEAEFLAAALLIIYAGAILVTYVFVIMLAQQSGGPAMYDRNAREPLVGCLTGFLLLGILTTRMVAAPEAAIESTAETVGTVARVGGQLLTTYIIAVQLAGVILLAAMVGAIAIARRRPQPEEEVEV